MIVGAITRCVTGSGVEGVIVASGFFVGLPSWKKTGLSRFEGVLVTSASGTGPTEVPTDDCPTIGADDETAGFCWRSR